MTSQSLNILVTGAGGFIGSRLVPHLTREGYSVSGPELDLLNSAALADVLKERLWDGIVHLAAVSHVPTSEREPEKAYRVNVAGTGLLLELMQRHSPKAHLIFTSTAQVYSAPVGGGVNSSVIRIDEETAIIPQNTYARTKRAGELLVQGFVESYGMEATVLRLFNHTHRSQSPDFFLPYLYSVLTKAHQGSSVEIPVGNLALSRDFGTIQDLLAAFTSVLKFRIGKREGMEYLNVCSGTPKNLGLLARGLAKRMGISANFVPDPARMREGEPSSIAGSHDRLSRLTGWQPQCSNEEDLIAAFLS